MILKDDETLRSEILDKLNQGVETWKPQTMPEIEKCLSGYSGNTLKVIHCLIFGIRKGKDIAEMIGISGAAVSKIINTKFEDIKQYLYLVTGAIKWKPSKEKRKFPRSRKKFDPDSIMSPSEAALAEAMARDLIYGDVSEDDYGDGHHFAISKEKDDGSGGPKGFYINSLKELKAWGSGGWDVGRTNPLPHEMVRKGQEDDYIRGELEKYWKYLKKNSD